MTWLCAYTVSTDLDKPDAVALAKLAGVPLGGLSPLDQTKVLHSAADWFRNNPLRSDLDNPSASRTLSNLTRIPIPLTELPPAQKKADLDDVVS